jgi:PST family polysaccharide transporter
MTVETNTAVTQTAGRNPQASPVVAHRLELNFVFLAAGEIVAKGCTFFVFGYLARILGPERYGSLEFVLAIMVLFSLVVDFGLGHYGTREIARNGKAQEHFREITGLRLMLAAAAYAALLILVFTLNKTAEIKQLLAVFGISLFAGPLLLQWFFQAHDQMAFAAMASMARQLSFAGLVLLFFRAHTPLLTIGVIECISVLTVGAFCLALMHFRMSIPIEWPVLRWKPALQRHWHHVLPIGLNELAWASMWYFATVMLGFLFTDQSLGWFGAAHRVLMALHTFVFLYFFNLLPSISRCAGQPHETLRALMKRSVGLTAWTSLYSALLLTLFSGFVMTRAFGGKFSGGALSLSVLVWMLPVAMLSGHHRFTLIAYGEQSRLLRSTLISAVVAIACGVTLVPIFGSIGAASALLIANLTNLVLVHWEVARSVAPIPFAAELIVPGIGLLLLVGIHALVGNIWFTAALATLGYAIFIIRNYGRYAIQAIKLARKSADLSQESFVA